MENGLEAFLIFFLSIMAVLMLFIIIGFIINATAIALLGKRHNVPNYGLAFLPFGMQYVMLNIPDDEFDLIGLYKTERKGLFGKYMLFILAYSVLSGIISVIPFLSLLILVLYAAYAIVTFQMQCDIFSLYFSETTAEVLGVIGIFFPIVYTVAYYICLAHQPLKTPIITVENVKTVENSNMDDIINSYESTNMDLDLEKKYDINNDNDKKYNL